MSMAIKICGITNAQDAEAAVQFGATHIGMIFVPGTRRCIDASVAKLIADQVRQRTKLVGVFCDPVFADIEALAKSGSIDTIQLHGSESPAFCSKFDLPVIKAFNLNLDTVIDQGASDFPKDALIEIAEKFLYEVARYRPFCKHILIDRKKGDTNSKWLEGAMYCLEAIEEQLGNYFMAGGLTVGNIKDVICAIRPYGVDVASGVEEVPGIKDHELVRRFCQIIKGTEYDEPSCEPRRFDNVDSR